MSSSAEKTDGSSPKNESQTDPLPRRVLAAGSVGPILLVEDDPDAVVLMQRILRRAGATSPVEVACDGEEAVNHLAGRLERGAELPSVVLLDLNMPKKSGFEVLEWMRTQDALRQMPTVVLSSSVRPEDIDRAYTLGATAYMEKSPSVAETMALWSALMSGKLETPNSAQPWPSLRKAGTTSRFMR